jgi:hypothetical protein
VASASDSSWSNRALRDRTSQALNQIVETIRQEMAGKLPETPIIDHIVPDAGQSSDQRNEADVREFPLPEKVLRLAPNRGKNLALSQSVRPFVRILRPYLAVVSPEKVWQERMTGGRRLLASGLTNHLVYGDPRLFADLRQTNIEQHKEVLVCVLIDTSASMKTDSRLERARRVAALLGQCLEDCPGVQSVFLGYNQNLYLCGDHEEHSLSSLEPAGKTNESAALDYLRQHHLDVPRRRKVVIVLSDGLPTACSVESVCVLIRSLEHDLGVRCLHAALSTQEHPAYRRRVELTQEINPGLLRTLGRALAALLR